MLICGFFVVFHWLLTVSKELSMAATELCGSSFCQGTGAALTQPVRNTFARGELLCIQFISDAIMSVAWLKRKAAFTFAAMKYRSVKIRK